MANGVNVKMGVSGVAQFKQNMNQAKQSVKTLDAQLKLSEKQFKASGDAESYMTEKSELLKAKLESQKSVLENAEKALENMTKNGIERSSKAYQDMYRQMVTAKGEILDTTMAIEGVESASDNTTAALTDMSSELSSIGSQVSFETVTNGLSKITDGLEHAAVKAFQLGKAIFMATLDSASWADEIKTAADKAGMSTKEYQQMAAAAELVDTSIDSVISSQQRLAQAAENDGEEMQKIFARLGVQRTRYGEVRDMTDLFWETGEALMKIDNEADQATMGKKLFGQWRELIPMFKMGREEYEKLRESQSYVDDKHMQSLTELDDSYRTLQHEIEVLKNNFFGELAPSIRTVTDALSGLVGKFNDYLQTEKGQEMMQSLGDNIEKLFSSITNFDPDKAVETIGSVMGSIRSGFEWISNNWSSVETGLLAIAGGWAAIKVATIGLNIAQLVNGFKGLPFFNGGNTPTTPEVQPVGTDPHGNVASAGAGAAGGKLVGISNAATQIAAKGAVSYAASGLSTLMPVAMDMWLNQTNAGRAARDSQGFSGIIEGLKKDVREKAEEISHNMETFADDWKDVAENNPVVKAFTDRLANADAAERLGTQNWAPSYMGGTIGNGSTTYEEANSKMDKLVEASDEKNRRFIQTQHAFEELQSSYDKINDTAEEMNESTDKSTKASDEMTEAARGLMDIPALVESAVRSGMSSVTFILNGQVVTDFVNQQMGEELNAERR